MLQKQLFWFTNYKSNIFHFVFSFCSLLSFSPLSPFCVSPLCLPIVSPRCVSPGRRSQCNESGWAFCADARALVENESEQRFHRGGLWAHQSYPKIGGSCAIYVPKRTTLMSCLVVLPPVLGQLWCLSWWFCLLSWDNSDVFPGGFAFCLGITLIDVAYFG